MKNRRNVLKLKKMLLLIVGIIAVVLISSIYAYMIDTDESKNVFIIGSLKIDIVESSFEEGKVANLKGGEIISKDPKIVNSGANEAYVYAKISIPIANVIVDEESTATSQELFTFVPNLPSTTNDGWTLMSSRVEDGYKAYYYYYSNASGITTLKGDSTTTTVFDEVNFKNVKNISEINNIQKIKVECYAVQANTVNSSELTNVTSIDWLYSAFNLVGK